MKIKQTAGRLGLGEFAPKFAELNDDVLFGEVWNREGLSPKIRSMLTITILVSKGLIDSSFEHHLNFAKANGVTKKEMAELLTHIAFYAGWPNAWAAFRMAKEVYQEDAISGGLFGVGEPNNAYAEYFVGNSYLNPLTNPKETVFMANVTFEPGCRNNWHIHQATKGGGQILLCVDGIGWYQEWGKDARKLLPGDVILYQGTSLCPYYGNNSWSFTRIGRITGYTEAELRTLLGAGTGSIEVRISLH